MYWNGVFGITNLPATTAGAAVVATVYKKYCGLFILKVFMAALIFPEKNWSQMHIDTSKEGVGSGSELPRKQC